MSNLPFRQVHLDFHTSEAIMNIGVDFSKLQFQEMLKLGHVNSVTVFSKCHHGWSYHPTKVGEMHPGLSFDLLGEMLEAAQEIGVKTPIYISAGLDEKFARRHPEWLIRCKDESFPWPPDFFQPGFHTLCFNSPYLNELLKQIEEVVRNYGGDGIFLDIVGVKPCYCQNCVATLRQRGMDPRNEEAVLELAERVYANYTKRVEELIHSIKPDMPIFHNAGHISRGRRDLSMVNTHLEVESLPTGGWGYDHLPLSARYVQNLGKDFIGMTGKFHTTWGEFGGYKHPNALKYETSLSIANGAGCSVGDQLHPEGLMDKATYKLIGAAYSEVKEKEPWCRKVKSVADIALLSLEAAKPKERYGKRKPAKPDVGAARILLEGKYLFDVIDLEEDFCKYKVIILPDGIRINSYLKNKLNVFFEKGGKVLATGESGLSENGDSFAIDLGVKWIGANPYNPDYFRPHFPLKSFEEAAFVFYSKGQKIELQGGIELGHRENPYFNRDIFTFCSHRHTPNSLDYGGPGVVEGKHGIYIAWNIFEDYATVGSLAVKETVIYTLDRLLTNKTLQTDLPAQGIVTLMKQPSESRYINHLLYATPIKRGEGVEIIEDIIPIYNVNMSIRISETMKRVYLAPQNLDIHFNQKGEVLQYILPRLECHQMVVLDYEKEGE